MDPMKTEDRDPAALSSEIPADQKPELAVDIHYHNVELTILQSMVCDLQKPSLQRVHGLRL